MPMTTGSDTRIFNPRSESMLGYTNDDEDYRHGIGDPKAMEEYRDKKQAEKEAEPNSDDLPHLQIEVPKPAPEMPPMMPEEEEEEPMMDDQFNEGQQFGAMTGMPDMGNLSIGNATGTMPQPGGTLMTGEPMEDAWSSLLKIDAELPPPMTQGVEEQLPMQEDIPMVNVNTDNYETPCECAERVRTQMITDTQEMLNELKNTLPSDKPIPSHGDLYLNDIVYAYEESISDLEILNCEEILEMAERNPKYAHMCQDNQGFSESEQMMYTGEPMEDAWSTLLKASVEDLIQERNRLLESGLNQEAKQFDRVIQQMMRPDQQQQKLVENLGIPSARLLMPGLGDEELTAMGTEMMHEGKQNPDYVEMQRRMNEYDPQIRQEFMRNISRMPRRMPQIEENRQLAQQNLQSLEAADPTKFFADQQVMTGEPMEDAWSTLMKSRLDDMAGSKDQSWKQPQYKIQPGGADISTATSRRSKLHSRFLKPAKKRGLDKSPLAVHRTHLGIETKQPLRLFPRQYDQQMGTMGRRKLMGNVPVMPAGHGMGRESAYNPKAPSMAGSGGLPIKEPRAPPIRGQALAKAELQLIKSELEEIKKKKNYMQFSQIRRLLQQLKDATERQESRLKASAGPGEVKESGHREGQDSTTRPEGATEDMENDPKNWGAPSTIFAARGSGRVG